jgi:hypothetical protein
MAIKVSSVSLERFKNAVGFTATYGCKWGNTRKANVARVALDSQEADPQLAAAQEKKAKTRLALKKQLIVSPEYDAIKSFYGELRQWVYGRTVPSFFKEGFQLATVAAVDEIETRMKKAATLELPALVEKFLKVYPGQVEEARSVLEPVGQFNPNDYPPLEVLRQSFRIDWFWLSFQVPEALPEALKKQEADKLERTFADAGQQITEALRVGFAELIAHATERLTVEPGAKPKVFRESLIGNIQEFIQTFENRNIMQDVELAALVGKAKAILLGVSPQKLRDYASVRQNTLTQFAAIQTTLDGLITERASRRITLDDGETPAAQTEPEAVAA